jgi:hypothetical protein
MIFTGVGSREAPDSALRDGEEIGEALAKLGFLFRSGKAIGMDSAFERGVLKANPNAPMEIYTVGPPKGVDPADTRYIDACQVPTFKAALTLAAYFHPNWPAVLKKEKEKNWPISHLHGRNIFQNLGVSLAEPSDLWIGWAKPAGEHSVQGGTNVGYRCARFWGINTCNLYHDHERRALFEMINNMQ